MKEDKAMLKIGATIIDLNEKRVRLIPNSFHLFIQFIGIPPYYPVMAK